MSKSILYVHLLNDYSGSPRVLRSVVSSTIQSGNEARIMMSAGDGFLSDIEGAGYSFVPYAFFKNKIVALIVYLQWQLIVFLKVLFLPKRFKTIYINTMHPFGAALAGALRRNEIIYHIHETSIKPALLKKWLRGVIGRFAHKIIFVSEYLKQSENFVGKNTYVVYNALSDDFQKISLEDNKKDPFEILMLCSLKKYKGVDEFVWLSNKFPEIHFNLVLNTSRENVDRYFERMDVPTNLTLHSTTKDVRSFYKTAHLVMNLSHRNLWIETFGMTIAEAFAFGIPVIVPEIGGIAELVTNGKTGFKINHDKSEELCAVIKELSNDVERYSRLRINAYEYSSRFNMHFFSDQINKIIAA